MRGMNSRSLVAAPTRAAGMHLTATSRGYTAHPAAGAAANGRSSGRSRCLVATAHSLRILVLGDSLPMAA